MDSAELSRWMAYDQLDVIPDAYWMVGKICQIIIAAFTGKSTAIEDHIPRAKPVRILSGDVGRGYMKDVGEAQRLKIERERTSHANG